MKSLQISLVNENLLLELIIIRRVEITFNIIFEHYIIDIIIYLDIWELTSIMEVIHSTIILVYIGADERKYKID